MDLALVFGMLLKPEVETRVGSGSSGLKAPEWVSGQEFSGQADAHLFLPAFTCDVRELAGNTWFLEFEAHIHRQGRLGSRRRGETKHQGTQDHEGMSK